MKKNLITMIGILVLFSAGCQSYVQRTVLRSLGRLGEPVPPAPRMITSPLRPDAALAVSWVGHATVLIQIHDRLFMTDPLLTDHIGMIVKRSVGPGLDPAVLEKLDFTLVSHLHFDHFSYGSLDLLPKSGVLVLPEGGLAYAPDFGFREIRELKPWEAIEDQGVEVTAVPVQHFSGRYGFDNAWMPDRGYTGYVIEYRNHAVFIGGDTGYHAEYFKEIGRRFRIDVAILPIAPGRNMGFGVHVGPLGAIRIFKDVGARYLVPMHHGSLMYGSDQRPESAIEQLRRDAAEQLIADRLVDLDVGEQRVLVSRETRTGSIGQFGEIIP